MSRVVLAIANIRTTVLIKDIKMITIISDKFLYFILLMVSLMTASVVHAVTSQSVSGGSGIGLIRTAEVMPQGESLWFLNSRMANYDSKAVPGESALFVESSLGYARSLGKQMEASLLVPFAYYTPAGSSGASYSDLRDVRGLVKYNLNPYAARHDASYAVSAFVSLLPGSDTSEISSGETLYGVELNISHWQEDTGIHFNIGYENSEIWSETTIPVFVTDDILTASFAVEKAISNDLSLSLQGLASRAMDAEDENFLLAGLFSYAMSKNLMFTFGGALGIPSDRSEPGDSFYFNFSYSFDGKRKSRYRLSDSGNMGSPSSAAPDELVEKLDLIDYRISKLENKLPEKPSAILVPQVSKTTSKSAAVARGTKYKVEIIVPTGKNLVAMKVFNHLKAAGYHVVTRYTSMSIQERSYIFYKTGMHKEAIHIGHGLEGNQTVLNDVLPQGIDIQLLLGRDLLK